MSEPIPQILGNIATTPDGRHFAAWQSGQDQTTGEMYGNQLSTWTRDGDLVIEPFPGGSLKNPQTAVVGPDVFVSDASGGGNGIGPVLVYQRGQPSTVFQYGDSNSRMGCSVMLKNGGALWINFVTFGLNTPQIGFDLVYRQIIPPQVGQFVVSPWVQSRVLFPNFDPGAVSCQMTAVEFAGKVWCFCGFDGSGRIDLLLIDLSHGIGATYQANFIGRQAGPCSPSVEIPMYDSVVDSANSRILLAYQNAKGGLGDCMGVAGPRTTYYQSIVEIKSDFTCNLLWLSPWFNFQDTFPHTAMVPRPDGIYFCLEKKVSCGTVLGFYRLNLDGSLAQASPEVPGAKLNTYSSDGWVIYRDDTQSPPYVTTKIPMLAKLSVQNWEIVGGQVKSIQVNWDNATANDVLEGSPDLKTWTSIGKGLPPVILPAPIGKLDFRITR